MSALAPTGPTPTASAFSQNLRVALAERSMTIDDLARSIRPEPVHRSWVSRRLSLTSGTSLDDLDVIAAALGVSAVDLIAQRAPRSTFIPGENS